MKQEDKQLLLADLCARLPYGVKVQAPNGIGDLNTINLTLFGHKLGINIKPTERETFEIKDCKSYLRPMSSMTLEELEEYRRFGDYIRDAECKIHIANYKQIDWLNAHHFDYRGLIPKGHAISTETFNPYKKIKKL